MTIDAIANIIIGTVCFCLSYYNFRDWSREEVFRTNSHKRIFFVQLIILMGLFAGIGNIVVGWYKLTQ